MKRLIGLLALVAMLGVCFSSCSQKKKPVKNVSKVIINEPIEIDTMSYDTDKPAVPTQEMNKNKKTTNNANGEYKSNGGNKYFLIAGSFVSEANANSMSKKLNSLGYDSRVLRSNGRFRVSYMSFSSKNAAVKALRNEKAKEGTETIWMYVEE